MKKAFDALVKPAYEQLRKDLGIKTITVTVVSTRQTVPVRIKYISHTGNHVNRLAGRANFYHLLGLRI